MVTWEPTSSRAIVMDEVDVAVYADVDPAGAHQAMSIAHVVLGG